MNYYRLLILVTLLFVSGCQKKTCGIPEEAEKVPVQVQIERLEQTFFQDTSRQGIINFIESHPDFVEVVFGRSQLRSDSVLVNALHKLVTNKELRKLNSEAQATFGDMQNERQQLESAFKVIKYYYPDFVVPEVKTFVSGLSRDFLITDSLLVLGIDFFIGQDASYRPDVYEYILKRYQKPNMVPTAMLLFSNQYNRTNTADHSLLAEMISTGKAYYFVESVLPCTPDSSIIGYSSKEIADVNHNEAKVWAHFIEKGLLYEKNPFQITKYIGERPNTPEIDASAPGRIGTWVGWQIVRKYMERNPEVTLPDLMAETNYQKIFSESKYRPRK